jgi:hypothetical protein
MTDRDNFERWYAAPIESLLAQQSTEHGAHFGIALVTLAFPLLERYCRGKAQIPKAAAADSRFYGQLLRLIPELRDEAGANQFWGTFRHGFLHSATIFLENKPGTVTYRDAWLVPHGALLEIDVGGERRLNPFVFARFVLETVRSDFVAFTSTPLTPMPTVQQLPSVVPGQSVILGTGSARP